MSIVKRHDVVQTSILLKDAKSKLAKIEESKGAWTDMSGKEREIMIENLHKCELNAIRQHANLAVDHQKMLKAEFTETLTTEFGKRKGSGFVTGKGERMTFRSEPEQDEPTTAADYYTIFCLNPEAFAGFRALKNRYQYFKLNKVSVRFVANTANNLSPIICKYLPPLAKVDNASTFNEMGLDSAFITKYAESAGTNYGFLSVHLPPCLVKVGEYVETADKEVVFTFGEKGYCLPGLCKDRCVTNFKDFNQYLDYGYLIFETRNISEFQSAVIQIHYYIDFYTGYDYEAAEMGATFGPGGEDDGGEGEGGEDVGETDVPDSTPASERLPKGVVKKNFKKSGH